MIDETVIDVPLLRKALEYVTANPEEWRQAYWITGSLMVDGRKYLKNDAMLKWWVLEEKGQTSTATWCGTTACLAGHVATTILGGEPCFREDSPLTASKVTIDGEVRFVNDVARNALGLTVYQADQLFAAGNSLAGLWQLANRFTLGEIEVPLQFR